MSGQKINYGRTDIDYTSLQNRVSFSGKKRTLTIEDLRKYPGCEKYSNEEAQNVIDTLYKLSLISYCIYEQEMEKELTEGVKSDSNFK